MVNKSLNQSLDVHLTKIKSGVGLKLCKKECQSFWLRIKQFFLKIKHYLFPPIEFEQTFIGQTGTTVVRKKDLGIKAHIKLIKAFFQKKKIEKQKRKQGPEEVEMSKVREVMHRNKIK